eukprot:sb/3473151/
MIDFSSDEHTICPFSSFFLFTQAHLSIILPSLSVSDYCYSSCGLVGRGKQPIRTCYLGHVTGHQPIRDQYFGRFLPASIHRLCKCFFPLSGILKTLYYYYYYYLPRRQPHLRVTILTWSPSMVTHLWTYIHRVDHGPMWLERLRICAYFCGSFGR